MSINALEHLVQVIKDPVDGYIEVEKGSLCIQVVPLPSFFQQVLKKIKKEHSNTTAFFTELFGEKRIERLHPAQKYTKESVKNLFVQLLEVYREDLQDLIDEIQEKRATIRFLDEEQTKSLRECFRDIVFVEQCTTAHIKHLMKILIPFKNTDDVLGDVDIQYRSSDSGQTSTGRKERAWIYTLFSHGNLTEEQWNMLFAKRLVDREIPEGVCLRGPNKAYFYVYKNIHGGGAFKTCLKVLGCQQKERNKIIYRGTRSNYSATGGVLSMVNDIDIELGRIGFEKTIKMTRALLEDPEKGFIREPSERVTAIAMSLGTAHLQRDIATIAHCFYDVHCFSGIRVNSSIEQYSKVLEHGPKSADIYIEADDVSDQIGEVHFLRQMKPKNIRVHVLLDQEGAGVEDITDIFMKTRTYPKKATLSLFAAAQAVKEALGSGHGRLTLFVPHSRIENQEFIENDLPHYDKRWEKARRKLAIPVAQNLHKIKENLAMQKLMHWKESIRI